MRPRAAARSPPVWRLTSGSAEMFQQFPSERPTPSGERRRVCRLKPGAEEQIGPLRRNHGEKRAQHDGPAVAKKPCDERDRHLYRRLCDPLAHDRPENGELEGERSELCATRADGDEPRPGSEVEAQSNEQVGEPERRE